MRRRRNPLSTKELLLAGGGIAVLGVVGYVLYNYVKSSQANTSLAQVNAATGQSVLPGATGAPTSGQIDQAVYANQGQFQGAQGGTPLESYTTGG